MAKKATATATVDPIDTAIEKLARNGGHETPDDIMRRTEGQNALANLLADSEDIAQPDAPPPIGPKPRDIWTLDRMLEGKPTKADFVLDGEYKFTFMFMPMLGTPYAVERFDRYGKLDDGEVRWADVMQGYCEVVYECLRYPGCSWGFEETVQDKHGNDLYVETLDENKEIVRTLRTVPLPRTLDNIKRLPQDVIYALIDGMSKSVRGEANTQR